MQNNKIKFILYLFLTVFQILQIHAGQTIEINRNWICAPVGKVSASGEQISKPGLKLDKWEKAIVPGTVLTTLLANKQIPDPFYGMNNEKIKDIYSTGRAYYTYWFVNDFYKQVRPGQQIWLHFRGVNYSCNIYLNGHRVNSKRHYGMFLRQTYNISNLLSRDGNNRLAVIVYPVDSVGKPNGGQGGDGRIACNVAHQYVAGWDWIQPIRDRNTGIWDKVSLETTGIVNLKNPHVVTSVPGKRIAGADQQPAYIRSSAELENTEDRPVEGILVGEMDGIVVRKEYKLAARSTQLIDLPEFKVEHPRLWWPNGYGKQNLYDFRIKAMIDSEVSDEDTVQVGIREIRHEWNEHTQSLQLSVNGQKIFIKGGNWIISDAMLRFSKDRYDAEIRYHRDMNLNLIRIWGGALPERPEFYEACNRYGLLVFQDFWMSGDCNGRWIDPKKTDDQWTRRNYPDNHRLFIESAADAVKLIRNNPSLAIWCGGNEITPPSDILHALKDSILPSLDGTRPLIDYSNSDSMSFNSIGGNGDGPYGIQPDSVFWQKRTWPFNSEVGSVGIGDETSLKRFLPKENQVIPIEEVGKEAVSDPTWTYHKYIGYGTSVYAYGKPFTMSDFAKKAQLVNYNQYRALIEGFSSHMWNWYTGTIIWKTQNPWTAMRGQMYDYYLDPNACLYGIRKGSEPLHAMCNPATKMISVVNNGFENRYDLMLQISVFDVEGKETYTNSELVYMAPSSVKPVSSVKKFLEDAGMNEKGAFLQLQLIDTNKNVLSDNFYWYPDRNGRYSGLESMSESKMKIDAKWIGKHRMEVRLQNPTETPLAFFNRISVVNARTKERILPFYASDNYVSIVPGEEKTILIDCPEADASAQLSIEGWNLPLKYLSVEK